MFSVYLWDATFLGRHSETRATSASAGIMLSRWTEDVLKRREEKNPFQFVCFFLYLSVPFSLNQFQTQLCLIRIGKLIVRHRRWLKSGASSFAAITSATLSSSVQLVNVANAEEVNETTHWLWFHCMALFFLQNKSDFYSEDKVLLWFVGCEAHKWISLNSRPLKIFQIDVSFCVFVFVPKIVFFPPWWR